MEVRIVWLRNKEGGQKIGNKQIIKKVGKKEFSKYVKPIVVSKNFKEDKERFGTRYVSLIKKGTRKWQVNAVRRKKSDLLPSKKQKKFSLKVKSFKSKKAKKWRKTADSTLLRK